MKKTNFISLVMVVAVATLMTSCFKSNSNENYYTYAGYCTISGSNPDYTLYFDDGTIAIPTTSSVNELTNNKGFGTVKRATISLNYNLDKCTTDASGATTINEAALQGGSEITTISLMEKTAADAAGITSTDSTYTITQFDNAWAYKGYLSAIITGPYKLTSDAYLYPTINAVYSEKDDISENAIKIHLYYNCHDSADVTSTSSEQFIVSYPLSRLVDLVPGSGDVTITIDILGGETKTLTVTRSNLRFQN